MNELEATRAKLKCLEMVEGTVLNWWECIKHNGGVLEGKPSTLIGRNQDYEFAIGVVEGKPVWVDSEVFSPTGLKVLAGELPKSILLASYSWNPPKPATLMVELPIEVVREVSSWFNCILVNEDLGRSCRKALEQLK